MDRCDTAQFVICAAAA